MKLMLPLILMLLSVQQQGYEVWSADIEQQRPVMRLDERLVNAANYKAKLMAETGIVAHCINGYCSNKLAADFGCKTGFADNGNQIESIAVGSQTVTDAYERLRNSAAHHDHLLGIGFFNNQDEVGVGYYEHNNNYFYVFISANCLE